MNFDQVPKSSLTNGRMNVANKHAPSIDRSSSSDAGAMHSAALLLLPPNGLPSLPHITLTQPLHLDQRVCGVCGRETPFFLSCLTISYCCIYIPTNVPSPLSPRHPPPAPPQARGSRPPAPARPPPPPQPLAPPRHPEPRRAPRRKQPAA